MESLIAKKIKIAGVTAQIHGVPKIFSNDSNKIVKTMWILFTIASAGNCGYFFTKTIQNYLQYPTVTNINIIKQESMPFPALTVCDGSSSEQPLSSKIFYCFFEFSIDCLPNFKTFYNEWFNSYCFQFNGVSEKVKFNTIRAGEFNGLELRLFSGLKNLSKELKSIRFLNYGDALHLYIHGKNNFPGRDVPVVIKPGESTFISIRKTIQTKLSEPYNNCINDIESYRTFDLKLFKKLTESNYTYRQKDCIDCGWYDANQCLDSCEDPTIHCDSKWEQKYQSYYLNKIYEKYLPYCPLECESTSYTFTVTHGQYPSYIEYQELISNPNVIYNLPNGNNTSIDEIRNYVSYINIYFEELEYTDISQQAKMEIWDLVSNIGGLMGLFLGVSFLSFIDILQILIDIIFVLIQSKIQIKNEA